MFAINIITVKFKLTFILIIQEIIVMMVQKEKKHHKFRISIILLIVVLCFGGSFAYYMTQDNTDDFEFSGDKTTTQEISEESAEDAIVYITTADEEEKTNNKSVNPVPQSEMLDGEYLKNCSFVGDSVVDTMQKENYILTQNTFVGENINIKDINTPFSENNEDTTIAHKIASTSTENIYIMLGSDDIALMTNDEMVNEYRTFIQSVITENAKKNIYILAIPPVTSAKENDTTSPVLNSAVDTYNAKLLKLADELGVYYVDVNSALKDSNGNLSDDYANDSVLSASACKNIIDNVLSHTIQ